VVFAREFEWMSEKIDAYLHRYLAIPGFGHIVFRAISIEALAPRIFVIHGDAPPSCAQYRAIALPDPLALGRPRYRL
jgi:hypothetical protein